MVNEQFWLPPSFLAQRDESAEVWIQKWERKKKRQKRCRAWTASSKKPNLSHFILCLRRMSPNFHLKAHQPNPLVIVPLFLIFTQTHRYPKFYTSPDNLLSCFLRATASSLPCKDRKQPRAEQRWAGREATRDLFCVLQLLQVEGTGVGLGVVQAQQSIQAAKHMKRLSAFQKWANKSLGMGHWQRTWLS